MLPPSAAVARFPTGHERANANSGGRRRTECGGGRVRLPRFPKEFDSGRLITCVHSCGISAVRFRCADWFSSDADDKCCVHIKLIVAVAAAAAEQVPDTDGPGEHHREADKGDGATLCVVGSGAGIVIAGSEVRLLAVTRCIKSRHLSLVGGVMHGGGDGDEHGDDRDERDDAEHDCHEAGVVSGADGL